jgi:hypothetical protein
MWTITWSFSGKASWAKMRSPGVLHSRVGSGFTHKHQTRLERLARDKRSSLFWKVVTYGRKKFYNIGHRLFTECAKAQKEVNRVIFSGVRFQLTLRPTLTPSAGLTPTSTSMPSTRRGQLGLTWKQIPDLVTAKLTLSKRFYSPMKCCGTRSKFGALKSI